MTTQNEAALHERLLNGTADPGMYPDCAEHVGMIDRGEEEEAARRRQAEEEYAIELAQAAAREPERCELTRERAQRGEAQPIIERCLLEPGHEGDCSFTKGPQSGMAMVGASPMEWHPEPEEEAPVDTSKWTWVGRATCGCIDVVIEDELTPEELDNIAEQLGSRGFKMAKVPPEDAVITKCPHRLTDAP
jgi:hypothetical protein